MNVDPRLVGAILQNDFCSFIRAIFPVVSPGAAFVPIPGEAAPHSGMMSPTDSEMISPTVPR